MIPQPDMNKLIDCLLTLGQSGYKIDIPTDYSLTLINSKDDKKRRKECFASMNRKNALRLLNAASITHNPVEVMKVNILFVNADTDKFTNGIIYITATTILRLSFIKIK